MEKTNKNKVEEFIRVDHAGERGAIKIYEGQLLKFDIKLYDNNDSCSIYHNNSKHFELISNCECYQTQEDCYSEIIIWPT